MCYFEEANLIMAKQHKGLAAGAGSLLPFPVRWQQGLIRTRAGPTPVCPQLPLTSLRHKKIPGAASVLTGQPNPLRSAPGVKCYWVRWALLFWLKMHSGTSAGLLKNEIPIPLYLCEQVRVKSESFLLKDLHWQVKTTLLALKCHFPRSLKPG